ncbi:hypothetical protein [Nostoc sp. DSM 114161]
MTICRDAIHRVLTQGCVAHAEAQRRREILSDRKSLRSNPKSKIQN